MNLVAIMPARNEDWVIGLSARAVLHWCDSLVILDHASDDRTREIAMQISDEHPGRVSVLIENDANWAEMHQRQRLLEFARGLGATHVAPVDADEVLAGDMLPTIRGEISRLQPGQFLGLPMRNLHRSIHQYRSDVSDFGSRAGSMLAFADANGLTWEPRNGYDHHQRSPLGARNGGMLRHTSGIMHLQFASWRRLIAKHARYKVMERCKYPAKSVQSIDQLYSHAPNERGLQVTAVPGSWWAPYADYMQYLDLDREPWHEAEVRRVVADRGAEYFEGLNLFGVA
jgi:glycosyltransferase involved in cell wall biosynthesis